MQEEHSDGLRRLERGFSVVELMIVVLITFVISAMALIALQPTIQGFRANAGMDQIKGALRQARETATSERRSIWVQFVLPNTVNLFQVNIGAGGIQTIAAQPFVSLPIEGTVQFVNFAGQVDTPEGFGNKAPIYFESTSGGPAAGMAFQSDGTFVDWGTGAPINGTVFLGVVGVPVSARAITVMGNTGRVRSYSQDGMGWNEQ